MNVYFLKFKNGTDTVMTRAKAETLEAAIASIKKENNYQLIESKFLYEID